MEGREVGWLEAMLLGQLMVEAKVQEVLRAVQLVELVLLELEETVM